MKEVSAWCREKEREREIIFERVIVSCCDVHSRVQRASKMRRRDSRKERRRGGCPPKKRVRWRKGRGGASEIEGVLDGQDAPACCFIPYNLLSHLIRPLVWGVGQRFAPMARRGQLQRVAETLVQRHRTIRRCLISDLSRVPLFLLPAYLPVNIVITSINK